MIVEFGPQQALLSNFHYGLTENAEIGGLSQLSQRFLFRVNLAGEFIQRRKHEVASEFNRKPLQLIDRTGAEMGIAKLFSFIGSFLALGLMRVVRTP